MKNEETGVGMGNGEWGMGNGEWGMGNGTSLTTHDFYDPASCNDETISKSYCGLTQLKYLKLKREDAQRCGHSLP